MTIDQRLRELHIELPEPRSESAAVSAVVSAGKLLVVGGQLPWLEGKMGFSGRVGLEVSLDGGRQAAKTALIQALSVLHHHLGSLNPIKRILLMRGLIACGTEFKEHDSVLERASELLISIFGDAAGRHARSAIGVISLPHEASVAVELMVEVK